MNSKIIKDIEDILVSIIFNYEEQFIFKEIMKKFESYCNNCENVSGMKGDLFEHFSYLYLKRYNEIETVWLYKDIPIEIKNKLNLTTMDYGIDLIGLDKHGNYYAVQSKYRKRENYKTEISWRKLSTFYAMANKSGPFVKHIVISTTDSIVNVGKKMEKEVFIGYQELSKINLDGWMKIANLNQKNYKLNGERTENIEDIRKKRIKYFSKKKKRLIFDA